MIVLIFLLGIIVGSFLNVCIYRLPKKEGIVFPDSYCPMCGTPLKWYNLIPIISFIVQKEDVDTVVEIYPPSIP